MRDLEIRGVGELLGTHQHGQIAAVGFHLYTRLLAEAARRRRIGEHLQAKTDAEKEGDLPRQPFSIFQSQSALRSQVSATGSRLELPIPISIPADYVPDKNVRLRLYRLITDLTTPADIETLRDEFTDRFGSLPEPVHNLMYQLLIRIIA